MRMHYYHYRQDDIINFESASSDSEETKNPDSIQPTSTDVKTKTTSIEDVPNIGNSCQSKGVELGTQPQDPNYKQDDLPTQGATELTAGESNGSESGSSDVSSML